MPIVLIVILLLILFGGLPQLGYHSYGYGPSGIVMVILVVIVALMLFRRI